MIKVGARIVAELDEGTMDFVGPTFTQLSGLLSRMIGGWEIEKMLPEDTSLIAVDVGACVGSWGVVLAHFHPKIKVYCFEPYSLSYKCLVHNAQGLDNLSSMNYAIDDKRGKILLSYPELGARNHRMMPEKDNYGQITAYGKPDSSVREEVETLTLDDLFGQMSLLKIDVEGMEMRVLAGAQKTIAQNRPIIQIEMNEINQQRAGHSVEELKQYMKDMDYVPTTYDQWDAIYYPKERVKDESIVD
jgi:FkbM family methyltransferase